MPKIFISLLCIVCAWCCIHAQIATPFVDVAVSGGKVLSATGHKPGQGKRSFKRTDRYIKLDDHGSTYLIIYNTKRKDFDTKCLSGVFRLSFDDEKTVFKARPISIALDEKHRPVFTFQADETDLLGPVVTVRTDAAVELEKFYDFGFSYSVREKKATVYLNGKKIGEVNDFLPVIKDVTYLHCGGYFDGKIEKFRLFNGIVNGDALTYDQNFVNEQEKIKDILKDVSQKRKNPFVPALAETMLLELDRIQGIYFPSVSDWQTIKNATHTLRDLAEKIELSSTPALNMLITLHHGTRPFTEQEFDFYAPADLKELSGRIPLLGSANEKINTMISILPLAKIQSLTAEFSDLKSAEGAVFPAKNMTVALLGKDLAAGYIFHTTPKTDGSLTKVDELRKTTQIRLDYTDGTQYAAWEDLKTCPEIRQDENAPLRNISFERAMLRKFFIISASVPKDAKPGFYTGTLRFTADGLDAGSVQLVLRILPLTLPDTKSAMGENIPCQQYMELIGGQEEDSDASRLELIYRALQQNKKKEKK